MRRRVAIGLAGTLCVLAFPAAGQAAVTIGSDLEPPPPNVDSCGGGSPCTMATVALPGAQLTAPFDGVIVRWRMRPVSAPANTHVALRVLRSAGTAFTGVRSGDVQTIGPITTWTTLTFPSRIPISAGDLVGLDSDNFIIVGSPGAGVSGAHWSPPLANGETRGSNASSNLEILLNADVEPDCDADGFGDETQDADLTACPPPPDTVISKGPKDKTKKKTATFEFSSSETATFECSVDGAAFTICASPFSVKVKKGKHTFSVRAVDNGGNADQTPATDGWKVKKKKKKH